MKATDELLQEIKNCNDMAGYLLDHQAELEGRPLPQYLNELLVQKNAEKADVIKRSAIQQNYGYQIFNGIKTPSRDRLIQICFGLGLTAEETQQLLKHAGFALLYPRIKRDSVILYALHHGNTVQETNDLLYELELDTF